MSQIPRASDTILFSSIPNGSDNGHAKETKPGNEARGDRTSRAVSDELEEVDVARHRFLSSSEYATFAQGVGGVGDVESNNPARISSSMWPPMGMPTGLYRDVVYHRTKYFYMYHTISILRWTMMILQLVLGAALTALGPLSLEDGTSITILGASNTIIAGLLALLHNSGLPDRHKFNMLEFELLQDHLKEILESRMAPADQTLDQVLANCYHQYQEAKATITANMPTSYSSKTHPTSVMPSRQGSTKGHKRLSAMG